MLSTITTMLSPYINKTIFPSVFGDGGVITDAIGNLETNVCENDYKSSISLMCSLHILFSLVEHNKYQEFLFSFYVKSIYSYRI